MTNKNEMRINVLANRLRVAMQRVPHLRMGQLIDDATGGRDLFYMDDDQFIKAIEKFADDHDVVIRQ